MKKTLINVFHFAEAEIKHVSDIASSIFLTYTVSMHLRMRLAGILRKIKRFTLSTAAITRICGQEIGKLLSCVTYT